MMRDEELMRALQTLEDFIESWPGAKEAVVDVPQGKVYDGAIMHLSDAVDAVVARIESLSQESMPTSVGKGLMADSSDWRG